MKNYIFAVMVAINAVCVLKLLLTMIESYKYWVTLSMLDKLEAEFKLHRPEKIISLTDCLLAAISYSVSIIMVVLGSSILLFTIEGHNMAKVVILMSQGGIALAFSEVLRYCLKSIKQARSTAVQIKNIAVELKAMALFGDIYDKNEE